MSRQDKSQDIIRAKRIWPWTAGMYVRPLARGVDDYDRPKVFASPKEEPVMV